MKTSKSCNCKASKCVKAYCDCYAAKQYCGVHCHCIDCQNYDVNDPVNLTRPYLNIPSKHPRINTSEGQNKLDKGCACKKSSCMKKYCECFNAGIVCTQSCKCIDCHNSESYVNRKVVKQLKKNDSQLNPQSLYRVVLTQNLNNIDQINDFDKNSPEMTWLKGCASKFCQILSKNQPPLDPTMGIPDHPFSSKTKQIISQFLVMLKEISDQKIQNRQQLQNDKQ